MSAPPSPLRFVVLLALIAGQVSPTFALDPAEIYARGLQQQIADVGFDREALHTEVKYFTGPCRIRLVMHSARLEEQGRADARLDLDFARLDADDIVVGQRALDTDDYGGRTHVVYLTPSAPAAAALTDGPRRALVGTPALSQVYLVPRLSGPASRDRDVNDILERDAATLLATTMLGLVESCRMATPAR